MTTFPHPRHSGGEIAPLAFAADPDGAALYKLRCAACHDISAETRAPAPAALKLMSPENIVHALDTGVMKEQGARFTPDQRRTVAEYLTGKVMGSTTMQEHNRHLRRSHGALRS